MKQKRWKTDGYLRIFASYYRPHWKLFALDMVCALCICLVDLAFPIVSRFSMQTLLPGQMFTAFFVVMAVLAGAYVLKGCCYYLTTARRICSSPPSPSWGPSASCSPSGGSWP